MSYTVWKYQLTRLAPDENVLEMPEGAQPMDVQTQGGLPCLWALVEPERPKVARRFLILGTGHPLPEDSMTYVGTVQTHDGLLVWHVFEVLD